MITNGVNVLFTDPLAANLFVLGTFFVGIIVYLLLMIRNKENEKTNKSFGYFLVLSGIYFVLYGLFFSLLTPKPIGTSYSILFYDPLTILGFLAIFSGIVIIKNLDTIFIAIFAFFAGIYAIISGVSGYQLGMTKEPLALLGLYAASGLAGILFLPLNFSKKIPGIIIIILLVIAALLAFYIGGSAVYEHLQGFMNMSGA